MSLNSSPGILACALMALMAFGVAPVVRGQAITIGGSAGGAGLKGEGGGLLLGGSLSAMNVGRRFGLSATIRPVDLTILPHDNGGDYRSETLSDGRTVCRDASNGEFSDSSLCGPRAVLGAEGELLGYTSVDSVHFLGLGAGYRAGPASGPYLAAALTFASPAGPTWNLQARGASKMIEMAVGFTWRWKRR